MDSPRQCDIIQQGWARIGKFCPRSSIGQSVGLRSRRLQVRLLSGIVPRHWVAVAFPRLTAGPSTWANASAGAGNQTLHAFQGRPAHLVHAKGVVFRRQGRIRLVAKTLHRHRHARIDDAEPVLVSNRGWRKLAPGGILMDTCPTAASHRRDRQSNRGGSCRVTSNSRAACADLGI